MIKLYHILNEMEIEEPEDEYYLTDLAIIYLVPLVEEKIEEEIKHLKKISYDLKYYVDAIIENCSSVQEFIKHEMIQDGNLLDYASTEDIVNIENPDILIEYVNNNPYLKNEILDIFFDYFDQRIDKSSLALEILNEKRDYIKATIDGHYSDDYDYINDDQVLKDLEKIQNKESTYLSRALIYSRWPYSDLKKDIEVHIEDLLDGNYDIDLFFAKALKTTIPSTKMHEMKLTHILKEILKEEEKAYHGTSHYFKCFRTSGIGGGTGAQMYGWGLYFGKEFEIASGYKGVGSNYGKKQLLFQGKSPAEMAFSYDCPIFNGLPRGVESAEGLVDWAEDMIEFLEECDDYEGKQETIDGYKRFIDIINDSQIETEPMIYVYEVLLHKGKNPDQYDYLNWDSKISKNQMDKINKASESKGYNFKVDTSQSGSDVYHQISNYFGKNGTEDRPDKQASLFLLKAGIDGNTHSNGSVRIIFDERAITIVNVCKFGK